MNEYVEIELRSNGQRLGIKRQLDDGRIELDENDPIGRRVSVGIEPIEEVTMSRMRSVRQRLGWRPDQFDLLVTAEGGNLVLRGKDQTALPPGRYRFRLQVEEARTVRQPAQVQLKENGFAEIATEIKTDDRQITLHLDPCDGEIKRVLDASTIDQLPGRDWLESPMWRPSKRACLLNLLASLRGRPATGDRLITLVRNFYKVFRDRAYARVETSLNVRLTQLARDLDMPFYLEGRPTAPIHERLLDSIPPAERPLFSKDRLTSFRGEGSPSLQVVVAQPSAGEVAYAEFDLDLGNALQDLVGVFVHVGELIDGKPTNHLDLHPKLIKQKSVKPFIYYDVVD